MSTDVKKALNKWSVLDSVGRVVKANDNGLCGYFSVLIGIKGNGVTQDQKAVQPYIDYLCLDVHPVITDDKRREEIKRNPAVAQTNVSELATLCESLKTRVVFFEWIGSQEDAIRVSAKDCAAYEHTITIVFSSKGGLVGHFDAFELHTQLNNDAGRNAWFAFWKAVAESASGTGGFQISSGLFAHRIATVKRQMQKNSEKNATDLIAFESVNKTGMECKKCGVKVGSGGHDCIGLQLDSKTEHTFNMKKEMAHDTKTEIRICHDVGGMQIDKFQDQKSADVKWSESIEIQPVTKVQYEVRWGKDKCPWYTGDVGVRIWGCAIDEYLQSAIDSAWLKNTNPLKVRVCSTESTVGFIERCVLVMGTVNESESSTAAAAIAETVSKGAAAAPAASAAPITLAAAGSAGSNSLAADSKRDVVLLAMYSEEYTKECNRASNRQQACVTMIANSEWERKIHGGRRTPSIAAVTIGAYCHWLAYVGVLSVHLYAQPPSASAQWYLFKDAHIRCNKARSAGELVQYYCDMMQKIGLKLVPYEWRPKDMVLAPPVFGDESEVQSKGTPEVQRKVREALKVLTDYAEIINIGLKEKNTCVASLEALNELYYIANRRQFRPRDFSQSTLKRPPILDPDGLSRQNFGTLEGAIATTALIIESIDGSQSATPTTTTTAAAAATAAVKGSNEQKPNVTTAASVRTNEEVPLFLQLLD